MSNEKKVELTENQLIQIAQQEEQELIKTQAQLEKMGGALKEITTTRETLKEIQKNQENTLTSIGAGIIIETKIIDTTKCKRLFSENAYKEEPIKETIEWLTKKEEQIKKQIEKKSIEYNTSEQRYTSIIGILKQINAEKRKAQENAKKQPITISK